MNFWTVPREWAGETAFIVAGGPSVLGQDLELLRGRRVIVINSSVYVAPWADFLYFGDWRWFDANRPAITNFAGRVVTVSQLCNDLRILVCRKTKPAGGLCFLPDGLAQMWTSLTAATNLAVHLVGPGGSIVWLGADGKHAADGSSHHHKPHKWYSKPDCYLKHHGDLAPIARQLRELDIALFNASPGTAWAELAPVVDLADMIERRAA